MNLRFKLVGLAGTVLAAGAIAFAGPLGVSAAADPDVDLVAATGVAGGLSPALPPIAAAPAGVLQTGTYGFNGGCVVAVSTDAGDVPEASTNCTITSSGTYLNVLCGTGTASGSATVNASASLIPGGDAESVTDAYTIVFVAGVGVYVGTGPVGAGVVDIVPTNATSGGCVTAPVASFNVTAVVAIAG